MKQVWVKVIPWTAEAAQAALESGADALWVEPMISGEVRKLARVPTIAADGDFLLGQDVVEREIRQKRDEEEIRSLALTKKVVVKGGDWTIIPMENLLSRTGNLFLEVKSAEEGRTAFTILEKGVDGVVVNHSDPETIRRIVRSLKSESETFRLTPARVRRVEPLGMGDRVCVDTCSNMGRGEGMLVGNSSQALFLVHGETLENPFVNPRPFRVNAGPVHAYVRMAGGQTRYLSEIRAGDSALLVNFEGRSVPAVVGRAKVERRPLAMVEAEADGEIISAIVQNAETIRFTQPGGEAVSLVDLKEGTEVLVSREAGGRHFGVAVDETICER